MSFPGLEGQPAWVIIVVVLLVGAFALGVAYLGGRPKRASNTPAEPGPAATLSPKTEVNAVTAVELALDALAEAAKGNAELADSYREQAKLMRNERDEALKKLTRAEGALRRCEEHARQVLRGLE